MTNYAPILTEMYCVHMKKIRTAVIGTGYLGKYHVEKFANLPQSELVAICDINSEHTSDLSEKYKVTATTDYRSLLGNVDAVSIATPTPTHYEIGRFFLANGVHVLMEKPITSTVEEAEVLINTAKANKVFLQVGHLERFNNAIKSLRSMLNQPRFIDSQRLAPFKLRGSDVNVVLDLMIHDIDIILSLIQSPIVDIRATGASVLTPFIDIANARLEFANGCVASVTASRVSVISERRLRVFQNDTHISLDLDRKKSRIHKKGVDEMFPGIPNIESEKSHFEKGDPLNEEIEAFLNAIETNTPPVVTGDDAKKALETAMEITRIVRESNKQFATT